MDLAYCSSECQTRDWQIGGHREYCKETRRRRAGRFMLSQWKQTIDTATEGQKTKLSPENTDFAVNTVLERDRILRALEVSRIVHSTRALAVEFDYTVFPMQVRPFQTLEGKPSYMLVQLKLLTGRQPRLLPIKYPMPKDLGDSVTSRGLS